jgi:hypothetical protein
MIPEKLKAVLAQEGSAAFVTQGHAGCHLVATWNSYLEIVDENTLVFPAGGFRATEANVRQNPGVQLIVGARIPDGVGFRVRGTAEFQVDTPYHARMKARFPWCRAAVVLHVRSVEQVLGT